MGYIHKAEEEDTREKVPSWRLGPHTGARDRASGASPNVMGLASLGLDIGIFCDFLYSVLLLSVILGLLDFLGLALSRPQGPHRGHAEAGGVERLLRVHAEVHHVRYHLHGMAKRGEAR